MDISDEKLYARVFCVKCNKMRDIDIIGNVPLSGGNSFVLVGNCRKCGSLRYFGYPQIVSLEKERDEEALQWYEELKESVAKYYRKRGEYHSKIVAEMKRTSKEG